MRSCKKTTISLAALVSVALLVTIYSVFAYSVASHVHEYNGVLVWPTPGYSFLPWPVTPTGAVIQIIEPLNQQDIYYYQYIIQPGLLIILPLLLWFIVFWIALKIRKHQVLHLAT
jgi:hypothetical protein